MLHLQLVKYIPLALAVGAFLIATLKEDKNEKSIEDGGGSGSNDGDCKPGAGDSKRSRRVLKEEKNEPECKDDLGSNGNVGGPQPDQRVIPVNQHVDIPESTPTGSSETNPGNNAE